MENAPQKPAEMSRAKQTWIIVGTLVAGFFAYTAYGYFNTDFSSMEPTARCEYASYRSAHKWDTELQCKAAVAASHLNGEPFSDDNPYAIN